MTNIWSVLLVFVAGLLAAQSTSSERTVAGNIVTSSHDPQVRIVLPKSVHYVGADRWTLFDIADCELHAFVEADDARNVQALYWVQFEGYIPAKPDLIYGYDSPQHTKIGTMDFFVDTWVRPKDAAVKEGSDREHIEGLLRAKGYHIPAGMMYVRFVHLLDEQKRRELMIIYGEDLASTGLTAAQLEEGGKANDRWPALAKDLVQRAQEKLTIENRAQP